jgi:hypothetical protein
MLFQAYSGFYFRIAGGYINQSLSGTYPLQVAVLAYPPVTRATMRQFQEFARDSHLGAILVEQLWAEPWMSVFGQLGIHGTSVGGVTVYQLPDTGDRVPARSGRLPRS